MELLPAILQGDAKADYVYSMYSLAVVHKLLVDSSLLSNAWAFAAVDFAGIVFLFLCASWSLRRFYPDSPGPFSGLLWLGITSPLLFRHHFYHPSDFYGVGLMFLALRAAQRQRHWWLAALCFLSGMLWEKALFVPFIYFAWQARRSGWRKALLMASPATVMILFWLAFWRMAFPDAGRQHVYAEWPAFASSLRGASVKWLVWVGPICVILGDVILHGRRLDRFWLWWLLYVPLLLAVMVCFRGILRELRSFWILQPIFAGVVAGWTDALFARAPAAGPVEREQNGLA